VGEAARLDTVPRAVSVVNENVLNQQHEGRLSPSVKRAVRVHNIDPSAIAGSGRGGRLTRADVDAFVAAGAAFSEDGVTSVPHDRMRLAIAANMLKSVSVAPHVTAMFECDFSAIIAHRAAHKAAFEAQGANLTFTAYFIAASAAAMGAAPAVNSRWYDDRLELYDQVNVGVGTALGDKGLVVPVIRDAQAKSLIEIAQALGDVTARARAGKLSPADLKGGTFTISNHGVSGSLFATPIIIAQPQSAILGIGKTEKRVVVREVGGVDAIQIRPMAYVSLTIDHRVVDGHQTNGWLAKFVETIEGWPL
jgi:2-oxoglutarate dehydrogenase E2 component (dihydrolipoamide succinyltransferase)